MGKEQPRSFFAEQWLSLEKPKKMMQSPLFHSLLNRGAANNTCYPPANCQQREITILSSRSLKIGLFSLISEV